MPLAGDRNSQQIAESRLSEHGMRRRLQVWHLITGEYPPQLGGVSDHTRLLAEAMANAGEEVHVWCRGADPNPEASRDRLYVHRMLGTFALQGIRNAERLLSAYSRPRTIVVQYVPHAFGWRSMNFLFIAWLGWRRIYHGDDVRIMFHEVSCPFDAYSIRKNVLAIAHRFMAFYLLLIARRLYISTPAWKPQLQKLTLTQLDTIHLPIYSNVPPVAFSEQAILESRRKHFGDGSFQVVGHFGTYSQETTDILTPILDDLRRNKQVKLLFIGRRAKDYARRVQLAQKWPANAVSAVEDASLEQISLLLQTCDAMLQPFPDGITTRRSSAMACLALGLPTITTIGELSESFWSQEQIALTGPVNRPHTLAQLVLTCLNNPKLGRAAGKAAREYYEAHFDINVTLRRLLETALHDDTTSAADGMFSARSK